MIPVFPKKCSACPGVIADLAEWKTLPLCGTMDDGEGGTLELRTDSCGSTLSILVEAEAATIGFCADCAKVGVVHQVGAVRCCVDCAGKRRAA